VGLGVAACGTEFYDRPALALLAAALPEDGFRVFAPVCEGFQAFDAAHGGWMARAHPLLSVVHGDPRNPRLPEIVAEMSERASLYLAGGLGASADNRFLQVADEVCEGGLSGVMLAGGTAVALGLSQGCTPIGPVRSVTAAERNVVMEIDGRPALDVFREDIGEVLARDLARVAGYIFVAFPVAGSDTGDYLVRNLTGIDPAQGWLGVGALVEPGQPILFCRRDHESARRDLVRMLDDLKRRSGGSPKAGLYFSCLARGRNLFGPDSEELKLIREHLGEFPLAGFFANGEVSHNRLYGYTGVLALFT
jgi:small ligand-binding sensory domain FIST